MTDYAAGLLLRWLPKFGSLFDTVGMRRFRSVIATLLLITLQVSGFASAAMGSCPHHANGDRHATDTNVAVSAGAMDHQHHEQHQGQHQHSSCQNHCTCAGVCAGGLTALAYQTQAYEYATSREWTNALQYLSSLTKPRNPFRPPIASVS